MWHIQPSFADRTQCYATLGIGMKYVSVKTNWLSIITFHQSISKPKKILLFFYHWDPLYADSFTCQSDCSLNRRKTIRIKFSSMLANRPHETRLYPGESVEKQPGRCGSWHSMFNLEQHYFRPVRFRVFSQPTVIMQDAIGHIPMFKPWLGEHSMIVRHMFQFTFYYACVSTLALKQFEWKLVPRLQDGWI